MKVIVTGVAGFIGMHVAQLLLRRGDEVVGIDNLNDYYDQKLKADRLEQLKWYKFFTFIKADISDTSTILDLFFQEKPNRVINLAAQAGVRYSLKNPQAYMQSNLVGFSNVLEACRHNDVEHLVYASSSSVYGANTKLPFSINDNGDMEFTLQANQSTYIPQTHRHRLANNGTEPLSIIEVQCGAYVGEDDIVRYKDNYGRQITHDSQNESESVFGINFL